MVAKPVWVNATMSEASDQPVYNSGASQGTILALGVDVATVRAAVLENVAGHYRLAAWQSQSVLTQLTTLWSVSPWAGP